MNAPRKPRRLRLRYLFWLILPLTAGWVWYRMTQTDVLARLESFRLDPWQVLGLIAFNAVIMFFFNGRWWLILRAQGQRVTYLDTFRYRMAAFTINYFTPGAQFGGEPLQIYALHSRHHVPAHQAVASVSLDKLFELLANFSFLAIGATLVLRNELRIGLSGPALALLAAGLMLLPVGYLALIALRRRPLSAALDRLGPRVPDRLAGRLPLCSLLDLAAGAERQMGELIQQKPLIVVQALGASLLIWAVSLAEYWLALRVLNVHLTLTQTVLALTAARLAFLTPLPGGIGALEAGQMLAMRALGLSPLTGFAISLWIRGRDLALGALGAAFGSVLAEPRPESLSETGRAPSISTSAGD